MTHRGETKPLRFVITRNDKQCLENVVEQIIVKLDHLEDTWVLLAAPPHRSYTIWGLTMSKWQWFDFILFFEFFQLHHIFFYNIRTLAVPFFPGWPPVCLAGLRLVAWLWLELSVLLNRPPVHPFVLPS